MEAGYDYLLLRSRLQRKLFKYVGIFVFVFGAMLLASGGGYYVYAAKARADLDSLNVTLLTEQSQVQPALSGLYEGQPGRDATGRVSLSGEGSILAGGKGPGSPEAFGSVKALPGISATAMSGRQLYPGEVLAAGSWSNPWSYEPPSYREQVLRQGFTPIESGQVTPVGTLDAAIRIIVPSVGIDSTIKELEVLDLGGSRAYETPDKVVGHIPATANAGETGSSWFFGHTESPLLGEGSVFFNLNKIPDKLRNGEDVFIITDNGQHQYLYRATLSQVVHQDDMRLYETGQSTIHLVSCVPRLVYDHRLIITGELIAQKTKS